MGYARDANTFISSLRLPPKIRNMLSSTRIPICLKTEIFSVVEKTRVHNTRMLKRRRYESINDRTCTVWLWYYRIKKPPFSFVHTKRISRAFLKISTLGPVFQNLRSGHRKRRLREEEGEGYVHTIRDSFFKAPSKAILYSMNSNGKWLHSLAAQTSCWSAWPRGFGALIDSSPHSWIFTSVPVGSSRHSYLFTAATGRIGVHFAPKYGKKPIR